MSDEIDPTDPSNEPGDLFKTTINEYLDHLPETVHTQLYGSPDTCLAIFRLLPSLAKFYIMSLLFQENAVPYSDLNRWIKNSGGAAGNNNLPSHRNPNKIYQNESIKRLKSLNLLKDIRKQIVHPTSGQPTIIPFVQLNPTFRQSFRSALTGGGNRATSTASASLIHTESITPESTVEPEESKLSKMFDDDDSKITIESLDKYCLTKWENILHFMVGSEVQEIPSVGVMSLLRFSKLMELPVDRAKRENIDFDLEYFPDSDSKDLRITAEVLKKLLITQNGFQFLLQPINAQIWAILLQYLRMSEDLNMNSVDVLNFIFMLGSLELGEGYPVKMLSETQMIMLGDLVDYGLIYNPEVSGDAEKKFYPTRLATTLTAETTTFKTPSAAMNQQIENAKDNGSEGSIIIETNFKIYCYTSSPLQIAILNFFVHLKARFSNMVTGSLTRESIRHALINGITADQIISYLESHAHPGMLKMSEEKLAKKLEFESSVGNAASTEQSHLEVLPPTVVDQVKLWQLELDRIQSSKGYLYKDFANDFEYEKLLNYGEEIGVILWNDRLRRKFFVTWEGNSQLIEYANRILRKGGNNTPRGSTPA